MNHPLSCGHGYCCHSCGRFRYGGAWRRVAAHFGDWFEDVWLCRRCDPVGQYE